MSMAQLEAFKMEFETKTNVDGPREFNREGC